MPAEDAVEDKSRRRRRKQRGGDDDSASAEAQELAESKGRATPGRRAITESTRSGNFLTRSFRNLREYLKGVKDELDKVVWPTREDTIRLSRIVLAVTIAASIVLGIISLFYSEFFRQGFNNAIVFLIGFLIAGGLIFGYVRFAARQRERMPY
jgi:preprotein translocase SecE subunit